MKNSYDAVVVGLGAMGSAALYQLSKSGGKVLGIDQFNPPHSHGSSFGETRVTRQAIGEGVFYTSMVLRANEIWKELEGLSGEELYNQCGMLLGAHEEHTFFQNTIKAAQDFSIEHQILDGHQVERLFPALKAAHTDNVFYYEPGAGFLRPEKCIDVQLKAARNNGATILPDTRVEALKEIDGSVQIKLGNGEVISAKKVVVTSGPWIKDMLADVLAPVLKTTLRTLFWFDIEKEHYEELKPGKLPVFLGGVERGPTTRSFYGFPAIAGANGGIKFSIHEAAIEVGPDEKDRVAADEGLAEELYDYLSRFIKGVKPDVLRSFNCLYTETPDENFIIDFVPDSENIVFASACSGHGFKHSAAVGEVLAQLVTTGKSELDISEFRLSRFNS